jgi:hypothetical protein
VPNSVEVSVPTPEDKDTVYGNSFFLVLDFWAIDKSRNPVIQNEINLELTYINVA